MDVSFSSIFGDFSELGTVLEEFFTYPSVSAAEGTAAAALSVIGLYCFLVFVFVLPLAVATYVVQALGFYKLARAKGMEKPYLAWIPFASTWLMGALADRSAEEIGAEPTVYRKDLLKRQILYTAFMLAALLLFYPLVLLSVFIENFVLLGVFTVLFTGLMIAASAVIISYSVRSMKALWRIYYAAEGNPLALLFLMLSIFISYAPVVLILVVGIRAEKKIQLAANGDGSAAEGETYEVH